jgi:hypothetical protein
MASELAFGPQQSRRRMLQIVIVSDRTFRVAV